MLNLDTENQHVAPRQTKYVLPLMMHSAASFQNQLLTQPLKTSPPQHRDRLPREGHAEWQSENIFDSAPTNPTNFLCHQIAPNGCFWHIFARLPPFVQSMPTNSSRLEM